MNRFEGNRGGNFGRRQGGFNRDFGQREMHKGNWNCSKCGTEITELPFEPDPSRVDQLKCRDCHRQGRSF